MRKKKKKKESYVESHVDRDIKWTPCDLDVIHNEMHVGLLMDLHYSRP